MSATTDVIQSTTAVAGLVVSVLALRETRLQRRGPNPPPAPEAPEEAAPRRPRREPSNGAPPPPSGTSTGAPRRAFKPPWWRRRWVQRGAGAVPGLGVLAATQGSEPARLAASAVFLAIAACGYVVIRSAARFVSFETLVVSMIGASAAGVILGLPLPDTVRLVILLLAGAALYFAAHPPALRP